MAGGLIVDEVFPWTACRLVTEGGCPAEYHAITAALAASALLLVALLLTYHRLRRAIDRRSAEIADVQEAVNLALADMTGDDLSLWATGTLERLARALGADRAWLTIDGQTEPSIWSSTGTMTPGDAATIASRIAMRFPWRGDQILVARDDRAEATLRSAAWGCSPVPVRTMLLRMEEHGRSGSIGFIGQPALQIWPESAALVTSCIETALRTMHRRRAEQERREREQQAALDRRMETVGALASGVAHNLNNLIAAISGFSATAHLHAPPGGVVANNLDEIQVTVRRARSLIQEVLRFGRRLEGPPVTIDLGRLLGETTTLLTAALPRNITLDVQGEQDAGRIKGEFGQLQQVLLNLCNNAAHAMPAGGRIVCRTEQRTIDRPTRLSHGVLRAGNYAAVSVIDEGCGIKPAALPRLFDPFFTTKSEGTGLGLSTAREIIQSHGGAIDVTSDVGHGSCFTLWLPLDRGLPAGVTAAGTAPGDGFGSGETVLLINVDAERLAVDEELVAALGYEPRGARDSALIDDHAGQVDAVLIAGFDNKAVRTAAADLEAMGWKLPVLLATTEPVSPFGTTLHYPLRPADLSAGLDRALARKRDVPARQGDQNPDRLRA